MFFVVFFLTLLVLYPVLAAHIRRNEQGEGKQGKRKHRNLFSKIRVQTPIYLQLRSVTGHNLAPSGVSNKKDALSSRKSNISSQQGRPTEGYIKPKSLHSFHSIDNTCVNCDHWPRPILAGHLSYIANLSSMIYNCSDTSPL